MKTWAATILLATAITWCYNAGVDHMQVIQGVQTWMHGVR